MKKAIIVGHTGQDGTYLYQDLLQKNYQLIGVSGKSAVSSVSGPLPLINIADDHAVNTLVKSFRPEEIYYLAAVHQSSSDSETGDAELFQKSIDVNVLALIYFLEAIKNCSVNTKLFYAASSHVFGNSSEKMQREGSALNPDCIYGITKASGINVCHFYKNNHHIFASVGIFYNHESPLRASKYVSKKIVETAVAIKYRRKQSLVLGNLESEIDWGYAPDYVNAAYRILQLEYPDDFIVSSNEIHTVREFTEKVFQYLGLNWENYVTVNPGLITKKQKNNLLGNNEKIKKNTGWTPSVNFNRLIEILVDDELKKYASQ